MGLFGFLGGKTKKNMPSVQSVEPKVYEPAQPLKGLYTPDMQVTRTPHELGKETERLLSGVTHTRLDKARYSERTGKYWWKPWVNSVVDSAVEDINHMEYVFTDTNGVSTTAHLYVDYNKETVIAECDPILFEYFLAEVGRVNALVDKMTSRYDRVRIEAQERAIEEERRETERLNRWRKERGYID